MVVNKSTHNIQGKKLRTPYYNYYTLLLRLTSQSVDSPFGGAKQTSMAVTVE